MKFVDYYKVMGLAEDASADDIKKTYRRLARKYHPDVSKEADAENRFKEIGEAYEVLKDPDKRREYDELRRYGAQHGGDFRPPPGWQPGGHAGREAFTDVDPAAFSDFFEQIFGRPSARSRSAAGGPEFRLRGDDIHARLTISLEDSYRGTTRNLSLESPTQDAQGRVEVRPRTLKVTIPRGVVDGQKIRLKEQGQAGFGGAPAGDLYLEIELTAHPVFTVDGRDINLVLPVAPWEAALGASVEVPTLGGKVKLSIPAGAKPGARLRLQGQGLPGDPPGDQLCVLQVVAPPPRSPADEALYQQMAEQMAFDPRATLENAT